jgi:DNA-binding GntR family transcriptional regulator
MPWKAQLHSIASNSLPNRIYASLRDAIFVGTLLPGTQLREQHLAATFGVSQNTVREALIQLLHVGLVQRSPNRGTFVTKLSDEEIRERIKVRLPLEVQACLAAADGMSPEMLEKLEKACERIGRCTQANNYSEFAAADLEFHRCIWEAAGNRTLYRVLDELTAPLFAFLNIFQHEHSVKLADVAYSHQPILNALRGRDAAQIEDAIRQHIGNSYDRLLDRCAHKPAQAGADRSADDLLTLIGSKS